MKVIDKIIAVDFDGTIVTNKYPDIGEMRKPVVLALLQEQVEGAKIILWTCRTGEKLQEAVDYCKEYGIEFDAVNENLPEILELYGGIDNRKITASEYWDDKAVRV